MWRGRAARLRRGAAAAGAGAAGAGAADRRFHAAALLLRRQRHHGAGNAGHRLDDALGRRAQRLHLLRARGGTVIEKNTFVGDEDVGDQPEIDDVAGEIRAVHRLQTVR